MPAVAKLQQIVQQLKDAIDTIDCDRITRCLRAYRKANIFDVDGLEYKAKNRIEIISLKEGYIYIYIYTNSIHKFNL